MLSSRMSAVVADIEEVRKDDPTAKFVIFSQHAEALSAAVRMLHPLSLRQGPECIPYNCVTVGTKEKPGEREENLRRFNEDPNCNICLLTNGVAATGLTLTIAHVCYMLEPTHNASDEAQVSETRNYFK